MNTALQRACGWIGVLLPVIVVAITEPVSLDQCAGEFHFGDGLGKNCSLTIKPTGTFSFQWRGCLGVYDYNSGSAVIENGVLRIIPTKPNKPNEQGLGSTPTEFFPIRWGGRLYLVATNDITEFCSDVNLGSEPRDLPLGHYYLRGQDWKKEVKDPPELPAAWRGYLLTNRVEGRVTQLIDPQQAWINVGSNSGLRPGMILIARGYDLSGFVQVRVQEVEKARCRIKCQWPDGKLELRHKVSSRFRD